MISPRMQALVTKVDAAEAAHFAGLHESAQRDRQEAKAKPLANRRRPTWSIAKASATPAAKKRRPA